MISQAQLDDAAFWDCAICLDCGATREVEEDDDLGWNCGRCGSPSVYAAKDAQEILQKVEEA